MSLCSCTRATGLLAPRMLATAGAGLRAGIDGRIMK